MNTGLPPITTGANGSVASGKTAAEAQPASADSRATPAADPAVPLPVSSSSAVSVSDNGKEANSLQREEKEKPSLQEVIELSEKLNESIQKIQRELNFSVDESLGEIVVKVIDRETEEVIRQIPSEEMLNLSRNIEEVNSLLFDKIKA